MPFGEYKDFDDCVSKNKDKGDPAAYCAAVHKKITGEWPAEKALEELDRALELFALKKKRMTDVGT